MADNVNLTAGDGTIVAGTDTIGGVAYPRAKVVWGPDGTVNDADVATGKPMPVQLRGSDGTDRSNVLPVTVSSGIVTTVSTVTNLSQIAGTAPVMKAASTAPAATDVALVVAISPNSVNANGSATSANSAPVVIASDQVAIPVKGDVASGSSDSGNPVKAGAVGHTAAPTAVTDGQRVNLIADKVGKLIAVGAIRDLKGTQKATLSNTTSETTIVTAVASTFLDLYGLVLANTGATTTKVDIRDTTGGSIIATLEVPTLETRGFMLPVDSAIKQTTVNTNWTAQCTAATTAMEVTSLFVKNI